MEKINKSRLINVMAAVFNVSEETINEDSSPDTVEAWDSLKHMNLILALEDEFEIEFSEDETVELLSYKLISLVLKEHGVSGI
jgi:acyl carrier protein